MMKTMNTPLKFDHDKRPNFRVDSSDFRAHYEDLAAHTLASIGRHGGLIASLVALALALACMIIPLIPRKYSAEALIYPNLFSHEQEKLVAFASVDAAAIVTGEARLIRSDAILRAVVKRLGLNPMAASRTRGRRRAWIGFGSCFYRKPVAIRHWIARSRCCATKWRS